MSDTDQSVFQDIYNLNYYSPLYGEVRSILDFPEFERLDDSGLYWSNETTQPAGGYVVSNTEEPAINEEEYVKATLYEADIELPALTDEYIHIYE